MRFRRALSLFLIAAGCLAIAASISLLLYNRRDAKRAERAADDVLSAVEQAIAKNAAQRAEESAAPVVSRQPAEESAAAPDVPREECSVTPEQMGLMPEFEIDGNAYIGVLSLPTIGVVLPVSGYLDYARLKIAPCRHFGSVDGNDLVIAGHSYPAHFGGLKNLAAGDLVTFTDMNGQVTEYVVVSVSVISANAEEKVRSSEWDLALYTCTYDGRKRVLAGCARVPESD